jgi:hypothetical protein
MKELRERYGNNAYEFSQKFDLEIILPSFGSLIEDAISFQKNREETTNQVSENKIIETQVI